MEQCGRWPQQACTTMFFLIPENVTSERPIALLHALIRWWEGLWAPEVTRWQQRHRVRWDATDGRNGGAERTVWETLLEMERFDFRAGEPRPTSDHMCLRVGLSFGCGPGRRMSNFFRRFWVCCAVLSSIRGAFSSEECIRGAFSSKSASRSFSRPSPPFILSKWS